MRHVPLAEFKDRASEMIAAAEAGEEIVVTREGRDVARLTGMAEDRSDRRRAAVAAAARLGQQIRSRYGPTSAAEIRTWIDEARR